MSVIRFIRSTFRNIEFIYSLYYKLTSDEYKENYIYFKKYKKINYKHVSKELSIIKNYWNCNSDHYVRYKLFNKNLSIEELLDYIPPYFFYTKYLSIKHKNIDTSKYKSKLAQFQLFKERKIPTPLLIGTVNKRVVYNNDNIPIDLEYLITCHLSAHFNNKLFFKPINEGGGNGIIVLKKHGGILYLNNKVIEPEKVINEFSRNEIYIIQEGIVQREDINIINSSSVNTLRVVIQLSSITNEMEISAIVMRIGRNGSEVDNSAQGGLSIQINPDTGDFARIATAEHGGGIFYEHPDSQFEFNNKKIANWSLIKHQISDIANKLKDFKDVALDIAITSDGVELIELNFTYGIDHLQTACGGMRKQLNVYPDKR